MLGAPADSYFQRNLQKLEREKQFSEDIKNVMFGGYGTRESSPRRGGARSRSESRNRSPGLSAGAALALGQPHPRAEACNFARQLKERELRAGCPFDDHSSFAKREAERATLDANPFFAADLVGEQREAYASAKNKCKEYKEIGQKVGAAAPFDTPMPNSYMPQTTLQAAARSGQSQSSYSLSNMVEAREQAKSHKTMMHGHHNLIGGVCSQDDSMPRTQAEHSMRRLAGRPPVPERILPQAQLAAQYNGIGGSSSMPQERVAYLNAKVLSEANRERNATQLKLG